MNTRYFHAVANGRRKHKKILRLQDEGGWWVEDLGGFSVLAREYFETLFAVEDSRYGSILEAVGEVVTVEDNAFLLAPFTLDEFKKTLFSMNPDKTPGPDGFNPSFYQQFWSLVGNDLFVQCNAWLE